MRGFGAFTTLLLASLPSVSQSLPFGLAAAVEPPAPRCELNAAFGAASGVGEWPLAHAALWLFNNRKDANFSTWQALWTLPETDTLLAESVSGAILINPGGPGGQPVRVINTLDNAPLVTNSGGRWFGYTYNSEAQPPALHVPLRLAINGLPCQRTTNVTEDTGGPILACSESQLTGCGFVWFCCGDTIVKATSPPPPQVPPGDVSSSVPQPAEGVRPQVLAAIIVPTAVGALGLAAVGVLLYRRQRRTRSSASAPVDASRPSTDDANVVVVLGSTGAGAPDASAVTIARMTGGGPSMSPWSSAPTDQAAARVVLPRKLSLAQAAEQLRAGLPPTPQLHPLRAGAGASRRPSAASLMSLQHSDTSVAAAAGLNIGAAHATLWASTRDGPSWRDLWGFNTWTTLQNASASSVQSSLRSTMVPAAPPCGTTMARRKSSSASLSAASASATTPAAGAGDVNFENDIQLDSLIGTGAFGAVYRGRWLRAGGIAVAVKMLHGVAGGSADELASFRSEVAVLSRLSHPCIVQFLGACLSPPHACMLEELVEGGSLHHFLHGPAGRRFTYLELLSLSEDIASAMAYLHPTVVHRDLKSQNVLLDRSWRAKVCDFGIAKFKSATYLSTKHVQAGTPAYMAPELFSGGAVSEKCDLWSFGTLLWEMHTGEVPWRALVSPVQVIFAIAVQHQRLPLAPSCPPALRRLLSACWQRDPAARPPFTEVLLELRAMRASAGGPPRADANELVHRTI